MIVGAIPWMSPTRATSAKYKSKNSGAEPDWALRRALSGDYMILMP